MNAAALALLLAWTLFAFGGVYSWAFLPSLAISVAGLLVSRFRRQSRIPPAPGAPWLDAALAVALAAAALQLVPLPANVRALLSPAASDYFSRALVVAPPADATGPLSLVPAAWLPGFGVLLAAVLTFWWARSLQSHDARALVRWIAWMSLAASALALVQPALFPSGKIYGFWSPQSRGAHPIGPIVSRNHFAAWVVVAWPLVLGYLMAHGRNHWRGTGKRTIAVMLSDTRALWLLAALALLAAGLLITESRAGAVGFGVAVLVLIGRSWTRSGSGGRGAIVGLLMAVALAVSLWASPSGLLGRFESAYSGADGGRPAIWRETRTLISRFPLTGIGLGAFDVVMPIYQGQARTILINHAHNQYLHLQAEGGLMVSVPLAVALAAFLVLAHRRRRDDGTTMVHVRDGAMAGLCGLALMSVFEVPSLTPAVVLIAAVAAALAVNRDKDHR